jgi:hypothetical protein
MTRIALWTLAALLGAAPLARAQATVVRVPEQAPTGDTKAQQVWAKLATQRVSLDFNDAPALEVFKFLRQTSGVNLVVDQTVRADAGLDEKRVSLEVSEIPLRSALALVLDFVDLVARWRHGVLLVTTPDRARGDTTLQIYDVRDITYKLTNFAGPKIELASGSGDSDGGGLMFGDEGDDAAPPTTDEIVETVKSALGESADAPGCSMAVLGGLLVARQTAEGHLEILKVLSMLRSTR